MNALPSYYFFLNEQGLIAYNTKTQKYYEVDDLTFQKLKILNMGGDVHSNLSSEDIELFTSLGFQTSEISLKWEGDIPSHLTHQSSRIYAEMTDTLSDREFVQQYSELSANVSDVPDKDLIEGICIKLPEPTLKGLENATLAHCFLNRKTIREFLPKFIELDELSSILFANFAPIHGVQQDELHQLGVRDFVTRRSSPSATGLASCDAIVWVNRVNGLEAGLYSYDEQHHTLIQHKNIISESELIYGMLDQFWIESLSAGIFIVNDLRRTWVKDIKCRGYLSSFLESGHLSQNLLLSATALNLDTWISGAFRDDFLQEKLSLPDFRFVSLFIGIGHGTGRMIPPRYMDLLEKCED